MFRERRRFIKSILFISLSFYSFLRADAGATAGSCLFKFNGPSRLRNASPKYSNEALDYTRLNFVAIRKKKHIPTYTHTHTPGCKVPSPSLFLFLSISLRPSFVIHTA